MLSSLYNAFIQKYSSCLLISEENERHLRTMLDELKADYDVLKIDVDKLKRPLDFDVNEHNRILHELVDMKISYASIATENDRLKAEFKRIEHINARSKSNNAMTNIIQIIVIIV